ncbi:Hypothetical protein NTJ_10077 [Nesidiocoris tenuis]|uniref:Uncharacterized protein n=1 Tax=Nesidiocoris tenuis TaxID=355587 RepID=A0ABN7AZ44_9HEMI|nr:Hypothetical protein NTJ_10077 [Nesidiocoris tenuis]
MRETKRQKTEDAEGVRRRAKNVGWKGHSDHLTHPAEFPPHTSRFDVHTMWTLDDVEWGMKAYVKSIMFNAVVELIP